MGWGAFYENGSTFMILAHWGFCCLNKNLNASVHLLPVRGGMSILMILAHCVFCCFCFDAPLLCNNIRQTSRAPPKLLLEITVYNNAFPAVSQFFLQQIYLEQKYNEYIRQVIRVYLALVDGEEIVAAEKIQRKRSDGPRTLPHLFAHLLPNKVSKNKLSK